jgi:carboxyl-terminal processing protease
VTRFRQRIIISIAVIGLAASSATVGPLRAAEENGQLKLARDYVDAMEIIRSNYVENVEYDTLSKSAIQGMLRTLDPHSNYYDRKSFEEMRLEQRSQYYGIGATIAQRYKGVYVLEPFKGTPAARAGLRFGDRITAIGGKPTEQATSDQVRNLLRGERGTRVKVTVDRPGASEPVTVTIERAAVDLPSISTFYMVKPAVGYINLQRGFHSTTSDELGAAIAALKERHATSMILDLRGNPGGFLDQAIKVADKFLQRGQIVLSVRGREGKAWDKDLPAESGSPETMPMVVLINRGTASASEIVAGAVQDHDRGLIVGEGSFGKGLVQTIFPLPGGAGLTLTTARYYTPSGRLIQRDYSNGSVYDYLYRRNAQGETPDKKAHQQERKTDLGRAVFGGGGIEPDIRIAQTELTRNQGALWTSGMFLFVRDLTGGLIPAAPEFKLNGIRFDQESQTAEFVISDALMKAYREYMVDFIAKYPELSLTTQMVDENLDWARKQIRQDVLTAAYGVDAMQRITNDQDVQLQKAVAELPNAAMLADRARRERK